MLGVLMFSCPASDKLASIKTFASACSDNESIPALAICLAPCIAISAAAGLGEAPIVLPSNSISREAVGNGGPLPCSAKVGEWVISTVSEPPAAVPLPPLPEAPVKLPSNEIDSPALKLNDPPALASTSRVVPPVLDPLGTSSGELVPVKEMLEPVSVMIQPRSAV